MVVIDFGARVDGYRSDTTRTLCVGRPSARQLAVYNAVRLANEEVQRRLQPGVTGIEMHKLAEEVLAAEGFGGMMGHGLGHGVGLDIHEEPCLNLRNSQPLPAGAVVTVEPGVYLSGEFGVRTEDCGLVAEQGFESFLSFTAMLSVSLGIMNLLPIPPLDGGRWVVETVARIRRRSVSVKVLNALSMVGMALFVLLFVVMMNQDIQRFVFGNW